MERAELRKGRGAFFTPTELTAFIAEWALRTPNDLVLEPSCGEAAFLVAAVERLRTMGQEGSLVSQLHGVELHEPSARQAEEVLRRTGASGNVQVGNFFDYKTDYQFDAVVGNPPYVRYQEFNGSARKKGQQAALAQGVRLTGLASSWAAFVIHASQVLKPSGRIGLVLPGELLSVNYASEVRRFLLDRFAVVKLVTFEERVFPGVLEEVVLLLAEGTGPTNHIKLYQAQDLSSLRQLDSLTFTRSSLSPGGKWTSALLPSAVVETFDTSISDGAFTPLVELADTSLGMVTGNNRYFTLSSEQARDLRIPTRELLPVSPPGSRHLRGMTFTQSMWNRMAVDGKRVYLFYPDEGRPSQAARRYIEHGEAAGVHEAYKCRMRRPWWQVPLVDPPDLFLTYMNHDTPRFCSNRAGVRYVNSLHGVNLPEGCKRLGRDLLPLAALNSVTILGAEIVGRSYGGGMLKLEPKEANRLPVPSFGLMSEAASALRAIRRDVARLVQRRRLLDAIHLVDDVLLIGHASATVEQLRDLRMGREALFARRQARASK